jgi:hypothetical protein
MDSAEFAAGPKDGPVAIRQRATDANHVKCESPAKRPAPSWGPEHKATLARGSVWSAGAGRTSRTGRTKVPDTDRQDNLLIHLI